jgi:hypothetical protein
VRDVPYVSATAAKFAREIEERFLALAPIAGVIFVDVTAKPVSGGETVGFHIRLGVSKNLSEDVGWALIQQVMRDEISSKVIDISGSVFTGFAGACRDQGPKDAHSPKSAENDSV